MWVTVADKSQARTWKVGYCILSLGYLQIKLLNQVSVEKLPTILKIIISSLLLPRLDF